MGSRVSVDIGIIGGGLCGLMFAQKLSALGFRCALVEKGDRLTGGPSTRNEGWLHAGTYHAISIENRVDAVQVARRCIYGHQQISAFAPEAREDPDGLSIAISTGRDDESDLLDRWHSAGVDHRRLSLADLRYIAPEARLDDITASYLVRDVGINTRLLAHKLIASALHMGCRTFTSTRPISASRVGNSLTLRTPTRSMDLVAHLFIYAAGYGTGEIFRELFGQELSLRFWKSHLLVTERLSAVSLFSLQREQAASMNHGEWTITGLNNDATLCETPTFDVVPESLHNLIEATKYRFPSFSSDRVHPVACIKVDLPPEARSARSLNVCAIEPVAGHLCVLPGKMTEIPYVTDRVVALAFDRLGSSRIALRPCDLWKADRLSKESA